MKKFKTEIFWIIFVVFLLIISFLTDFWNDTNTAFIFLFFLIIFSILVFLIGIYIINQSAKENLILRDYIKDKMKEDPETIIEKKTLKKERKMTLLAQWLMILVTVAYTAFSAYTIYNNPDKGINDFFDFIVNFATLVALIAVLEDRLRKS